MSSYSTRALPRFAVAWQKMCRLSTKPMRRLSLASAFIFLIGIDSAKAINDMIPEHGKYSTKYQSNWAYLPDGKNYPRKKISEYSFTNVIGDNVKQRFDNLDTVRISGKYWKVKWNRSFDKYGTTLFYFKNVKNVIIEDMAIINENADFRAASAFLCEECGSVTIRNVYIAGASYTQHIRLFGYAYAFIDNVEVTGYNYGGSVRGGEGIRLDNGEAAKGGISKTKPYFAVVQNCYLHDMLMGRPGANQDGVNLTSPADGILFNNYFENWKGSDASADVSHRRDDPAYQNHIFRIECNVFRRNKDAKTPGGAGGSNNKIIGANNIFIDTQFNDYHDGFPTFWIHNTYIATPAHTAGVLFNAWGISGGGHVTLSNNLFIPNGTNIIGGSNYSMYYNSTSSPSCFANYKSEDFRLVSSCPAINDGGTAYLGSTPALKVDKDFNGKLRSPKPDNGAFEF